VPGGQGPDARHEVSEYRGLAALASAFLLVLPVDLAILLPPFAHLRPVLVDAQPAFQLLGAALLLRRRVPFALLLAQGFRFLLQGIVTRLASVFGNHDGRAELQMAQLCVLGGEGVLGKLAVGSRSGRGLMVRAGLRPRTPGDRCRG
jgi:hypothetical protein